MDIDQYNSSTTKCSVFWACDRLNQSHLALISIHIASHMRHCARAHIMYWQIPSLLMNGMQTLHDVTVRTAEWMITYIFRHRHLNGAWELSA